MAHDDDGYFVMTSADSRTKQSGADWVSDRLPNVSVIIPVHNAAGRLPLLLTLLRAQDYPREKVELILIDNNSTDGSNEIIAKADDVTALSFTDWNSSYAARNLGIERSTGEVLAFTDSDCRPLSGWLSAGISALINGEFDMAAGRMEFIMPESPNVFSVYDAGRNLRQDDFVSRGWAATGNLFVRREVFDDIGLFDDSLVSAGDCEFGLRATGAGKRLTYAADAVVRHFPRASLGALMKKWFRTEYGAAQVYRRYGLMGLHLWKKKANWRPLLRVWKDFPEESRRTLRRKLALTLLGNILRLTGNVGNILGYYRTAPGARNWDQRRSKRLS